MEDRIEASDVVVLVLQLDGEKLHVISALVRKVLEGRPAG
jgi:hypothetical protein